MSDSIADAIPLQSLKWYKSILSWINSFDSIKSELSSITDLSDSTLLIDCIIFATPDKTALPCTLFQEDSDIENVKSHEYTFSKILAVFSEFFQIPLDQAISLADLTSGSEHELIKLLLIFLAYAVQQKPNERIIQGILDLDIEVQVCLGKLIEDMFQKLGRKQIEAIQDLVTNLDLENDETPETDQTAQEIDNFMITELPDIADTVTPPLQSSPDLLILETPVLKKASPLYETPVNEADDKQESLFGVASRYYGFDSPAALKWINRPEIKQSLKRPDFTRPTPAKINQLHQLQHKVNQQQEELHILRKFCQEKETELIERIEQLAESELTSNELRKKCFECDDLLNERVSLCNQAQSLERENQSLKKDVAALIGYKDKCEDLQDMADELASTAKGNQTLIMNVEKLQLELTSEKDKIFQLESDKTVLERNNMEYQASVQLLGQEKQVLGEELELVRERLVQLDGDLSALKKSKVAEVEKEEREKISERNDEIALLFKIKLLEEEVFELRKVLPKASERDHLEIELKMMTSEFEKMRDSREDLCKRYSEMKSDSLRLEGKVIELEKYRTQLEESKDIVASLKKENSSLKLEIHSEISTHTTLSTENQRLELQLDQTGREMEMLKRHITELDTTVLSIQETYNELFCLKEKLLLDNDSMDKELVELRTNTVLLQEREMRASTELNSVISQRNEDLTLLNSRLSSLQEKNCDLQSESKSLELKLSAAVSERISKEETISFLSETTNKRELELKEALQTITNRNSELQREIHEIKLEFASAQGQLEISNKRFERKAEELSQESLDYEKRKKDLESRLEQVLMQSKSRAADMQTTITSLRGDALDLARNNQTLQQEKQKLSAMVKEYEFMQVDNSCRIREELDDKINTVRILEERLDEVESERNTLHSQIRSLNVQLQFANTQLTESKKSSTESSRNQHRSDRTNTDTINRPIQQFTSITDMQPPIEPDYYSPSSQRSKWGKSVDSISSKMPSHSRYRAPMYSASIESQESSSSIQSIGEPCEPKKDSVNRTQEIKCRNAQNLPHLKSSYPIEFQTTSLSERYLQSESPNVEPTYQPPKLSQVPYLISQNPAKRKALAFEIELGSDGASSKSNSKHTSAPPRVLRSNKSKLSQSVSQSSISNRKRKT